MYPITNQATHACDYQNKLFKQLCRLYQNMRYHLIRPGRWLFFGIRGKEGLDKSQSIAKLRESTTTIEKKIWDKILTVFLLSNGTIVASDYENIYSLINSYVAANSKEHQNLSSYRYHMVFNYHSRLAYTFHIGLKLCLVLLLLPFFFHTSLSLTPKQITGISALLLYLSRHFGKECKLYYSRETKLLFEDFYTVAITAAVPSVTDTIPQSDAGQSSI